MSNLLADAIEDIISIVQGEADKGHPAYDELDRELAGPRGDYTTRAIDDMANNTLGFYEFFLNDLYRNKSEKECWQLAVDQSVDIAVANIALGSRYVLNKLSDNEIRDYEDIQHEGRLMAQDAKRYLQYNRNNRNGYDRYDSGRGVRGNSRYADRSPAPRQSRQTPSIFSQDNRNYAGAPQPSGGNARAEAMANRSAQRQAESERQRENTRQQQQARASRRVSNQTSSQTTTRQDNNIQYITSRAELILYPKRPGQFDIPTHDPVTQCVQAYLDKDGFVAYNILEKSDMDAEMHKTVIQSMLSKSREGEYVKGMEKRAVYKVGEYEVDAAQVENDRVEAILSEWRTAGKIKEGTSFKQLDDNAKTEVLSESAKRLVENRMLRESEETRKRIEAGTNDVHKSELNIVSVRLPQEVNSVSQAISTLVSRYGDEITADTYRTKGYQMTYRTLNVIHRCTSPTERNTYANVLIGFKPDKANVLSMKQSLDNKFIPVGLFTQLNNQCTTALNKAVQYILGAKTVDISSFYDEIDEVAGWLKNQVEEGYITNEVVNTVNKYVTQASATLNFPTEQTLQQYFTNKSEREIASMKHHCIFSSESGYVIYLPLLSGELGLTNGINEITISDYPLYSSLLAARKFTPSDYIYTLDGRCYRYIAETTKGNLLLENISL